MKYEYNKRNFRIVYYTTFHAFYRCIKVSVLWIIIMNDCV